MKLEKSSITLLLSGIISMALLVVIAINPMSFQRFSQFKVAEDRYFFTKKGEGVDIKSLLEDIPYQQQSEHSVLRPKPSNILNRTIYEGVGNCAEFVNGMALYLANRNQPYEIVHFYRKEMVGSGYGHSMLKVNALLDGNSLPALVDVQHGSVVTDVNDKLLTISKNSDLEILSQSRLKSFSLLHPDRWITEVVDISDVGYFVGFIRSVDNNLYHDFLETIYFSVDNSSLERLIYKGIALLLGFSPSVYIDEAQYEDMKTSIWTWTAIMWLFRVSVAIGLVSLLIVLAQCLRCGLIDSALNSLRTIKK